MTALQLTVAPPVTAVTETPVGADGADGVAEPCFTMVMIIDPDSVGMLVYVIVAILPSVEIEYAAVMAVLRVAPLQVELVVVVESVVPLVDHVPLLVQEVELTSVPLHVLLLFMTLVVVVVVIPLTLTHTPTRDDEPPPLLLPLLLLPQAKNDAAKNTGRASNATCFKNNSILFLPTTDVFTITFLSNPTFPI